MADELRNRDRIRWLLRIVIPWMSFGQAIGIEITWWQVIGMIWGSRGQRVVGVGVMSISYRDTQLTTRPVT
jgi:hypothetical protein